MRSRILRTLLHKELLRHAANRGGLALSALLIVAALLLGVFDSGGTANTSLVGGVHHCFIDFDDGPLLKAWSNHLDANKPPELARQVRVRPMRRALLNSAGVIVYPTGTGAIQIRQGPGTTFKVWIWYPAGDALALTPFEAWFWQETRRFFRDRAGLPPADADDPAEAEPWLASYRQFRHEVPAAPELTFERSPLTGGVLDARSAIATSMVLFALFFFCVYLLPSLTCEERERGVLLAQALSPATPLEILAAKFLFYPVAGLVLAAILAGAYKPAVLATPFFWIAAAAAAVGSLGVGLTISCLARTQRTASMGAMCYMLAVSLLILICQQNNIPGLPNLFLEYHSPRALHAALSGQVEWFHWGNVAGILALASVWCGAAVILFRRRGWQ